MANTKNQPNQPQNQPQNKPTRPDQGDMERAPREGVNNPAPEREQPGKTEREAVRNPNDRQGGPGGRQGTSPTDPAIEGDRVGSSRTGARDRTDV